MAAQNIGAGRWDRVTRIATIGVGYNFLLTGALVALLYLFDHAALGLFLPHEGEAMGVARHINNIVAWSFVLFGVTMVLIGTVRANGAVWPPLIILVIGLIPVRFGWIFGTEQWLGADALWTSFPISSFVNLALAAGYYWKGGWRKAHMRVEECPDEEECTEEALATREPGGALNPAG